MTEQASFALRGHNPDVLTCIANLSNDEVFTPPELANQMLDTLEQAWAESNDGASVWADPDVTFLDPFTKSGVFLREITRRLTDGLSSQIPDLEERVDHVLTKQVFGIGITRLTALLARRSVYCSKDATGEHSIAKSFDRDWGNIWFERTEHEWAGGTRSFAVDSLSGEEVVVMQNRRCRFCAAAEAEYGRDEQLESHAYAFIHTDKIKARVRELFGADMQFDVIIGNPPYQLSSDGGTRDVPIYQRFIESAKALEPRFLSMIVPSRWMAGGLGLAEFRADMLADNRIRSLVDYPVSKDVFPGVEVKGGVCHFLWGRDYLGQCVVTTRRGDDVVGPVDRYLNQYDVFVRDLRAVRILERVLAQEEPALESIMSSRTAFGLASNFKGYRQEASAGDVRFYATSTKGRFTGWVGRDQATVNSKWIDTWKAMVPKAGSDGGQKLPDIVLGKPWIAESPSICTQSFLFVPTASEAEARSVTTYYRTRFVRFLVSLRKITQDTTAASYRWVPQQAWDRDWTDEALYEKYGFSDQDVNFIESQVKSMELNDDEA